MFILAYRTSNHKDSQDNEDQKDQKDHEDQKDQKDQEDTQVCVNIDVVINTFCHLDDIFSSLCLFVLDSMTII